MALFGSITSCAVANEMATQLKMDICIAYLLTLITLPSVVSPEDEVLLSVSRRQTGDIYTIAHNSTMVCPADTPTFLADKRRCICNEELFKGNLSV